MDPFETYYRTTPTNEVLWNKLPEDELFLALQNYGINGETAIVSSGCGTGQKEIYAAERGFSRIHAFDISPTAIAQAQRLAARKSVKVDLFCEDVFRAHQSPIFTYRIGTIGLWVDWMSFHNMTPDEHVRYAKIIGLMQPWLLLIRSFSKTDAEYRAYKKTGGQGRYLTAQRTRRLSAFYRRQVCVTCLCGPL